MFLRMVSTGWAAEEFKTIDLGDKRLDKRAVLLAERLAEKPTASIPEACSGWAETQAAYRFLAQYGVAWQDILEAALAVFGRAHGRTTSCACNFASHSSRVRVAKISASSSVTAL